VINQVIIVGRLGRDPEVQETTGGARFAKLSIATSDTWRDKATGEKRERTEWHRVVVWGDGLAGMLKQYATKGGQIYVQGALETRSWEKDGQKRYATEIVVKGGGVVRLLGSSGAGGSAVPDPTEEPEGY
jgi:single-strand DNA-binding protein